MRERKEGEKVRGQEEKRRKWVKTSHRGGTKGWRSTNKEDSERLYRGLRPSHLLFCPVPRWVVFLRPVGYFGLSVSEQLGMDAIMLQEKLVERLLCPRVRTARQKVKKIYKYFWGINGWKKRRENFALWKKKKNPKHTEFRIVLKMKEQEGSTCGHFSGGDWRFIFFYCPHRFFVQSFFHSLPWLFFVSASSRNCLHRLRLFYLFIFLSSEWVVFLFFFLSAILTRGGCRKRPWQVVTAFTDARCALLLWGCGVKKELFVCERTLLTDLCCAFLCTHGNTYRGDGVTCFFFFLLPDAAEKSSRTEGCLCDAHTEWLVAGGSLCVCENFGWKIWGASYSQPLTQREMLCTCFSMQL